jgi:glycosyltransferase involved in cell wall biosynthesis
VVRDGETGLIVPERDAEAVASAIERLADDPDLAKRLGSAGRALVRSEFDIERNVSRLVELFRSVAARPAPDGGRR